MAEPRRRAGRGTLLVAGALLALSGCARYVPHPLDPALHRVEFRARGLDDPALRALVERHAGPLPPHRWTDRHLGLVALALRADLERARREWLAARAAMAAAGGRPPPGAEAGVERAVAGREEPSPWVVSLAGLFTFELGGKRAARLQGAGARVTAAEAELAIRVAETLGRVRQAVLALDHLGARRAEALAAVEAVRRIQTLEQDRYAEAALGSAELARTAIEAAGAGAEATAIERELVLARADLAAVLALPAAATREVMVEPSSRRECAWGLSAGEDSLGGLALRRRGEIARALADYALAEAEVRSRVSESYPDLELGPGFIWDQGVHRWTLGVALPALLGVRVQGPIRASETARHAAAARVAEAQEALLAEVGRALEGCRGARLEQAVADSQRVAADRAAGLARATYDRGETGRLELARAELLRASAAQHRSY